MKPSEIRELNDAEIVHEIQRLRREVFDLRTKAVTEKLENPRQFSVLKKDIARLMTEQTTRANAQTAQA
ncbi:MAG: 50S ribosomal protein L29 [Phycisphaeraceae bacterium]